MLGPSVHSLTSSRSYLRSQPAIVQGHNPHRLRLASYGQASHVDLHRASLVYRCGLPAGTRSALLCVQPCGARALQSLGQPLANAEWESVDEDSHILLLSPLNGQFEAYSVVAP